MKELQPTQEQQIEQFAYQLAMIDGPEDMFPPDSFVREPRHPYQPTMPGTESIALAAVYDIAVARENRRQLMHKSGVMVLHINQLVGA